MKREFQPRKNALRKQMQRVYEIWGLPRNPKKAAYQELEAVSLGAQILGDIGIIRPKPQKMLESSAAALLSFHRLSGYTYDRHIPMRTVH